MSEPVVLGQPTFGDEEVEAVREVLKSGWVAGQGPKGRAFEERFAQTTGTAHAVAVNNCTAALHLSFLALGIGAGDEVLVADYTYPATGHSVRYTGAHPVFVDVRPDTWTMDPDAAAAAITERTRAIVAVDVFGQCADWDPLRELADEHGLKLVEDAAAAAGATYRGRPAGSLADVACFSLHGRKGITSGEGGVLVTDDEHVAQVARKLSCFGVESAFTRQGSDDLPVPEFEMLGYNYKLSDIGAAIALVQLDRLPALLEARRKVAAQYHARLSGVPGIALPVEAEDREHTWQTYTLTLDPKLSRGAVAQGLRSQDVQANIGTFASHVQPVYDDPAPCPVSADLFTRHLAIPMHANLTDGEVERVVDVLCGVLDEQLATARGQ